MRTIDEAKSLIESWGKKAGLNEDGLKALLGNEEILKEAQNHLTNHSEMASGIDRARNEAQAKLKEYTDWYNNIAEPSVKQANQLKAAYERYRQQFGDLEGEPGNGGQPRNQNGQFVSRQELDAYATTGAQVAKQLAFITSDYNSRFGPKHGPMTYEQLEEWENFAVSRGKPPIESYREWIAPKEKELREAEAAKAQADTEARIKAAREEGFREGQTRRQWGSEAAKKTDNFGRDLKALETAKADPEAQDRAADAEFMKGWEEWDQAHAADVR